MLIASISITLLFLIFMVALLFVDRTALIIAISNVLSASLLFSIPLLFISIVTKPVHFQTKQNKIFKGVFVVASIVTIMIFAIPKSFSSATDLSAVLSDDFYYVEGEVTNTFILSSPIFFSTTTSNSYTQMIIVENNRNDVFKYYVNDIEDYRLLKGEHYKIKALPGSKLILEYEHVVQKNH